MMIEFNYIYVLFYYSYVFISKGILHYILTNIQERLKRKLNRFYFLHIKFDKIDSLVE